MVKLHRSTLFNLDKINRTLAIEKQLLISDALIRRHIRSSGCKASRNILLIIDNESTRRTTWIPPKYQDIVYNARFRNVFICISY